MLKSLKNHLAAKWSARIISDNWQEFAGDLDIGRQRTLAWRLFKVFSRISPAWSGVNKNWIIKTIRR